MTRQRRLTNEQPVELVAIVDESVLHQPVGDTMFAQLTRLVEATSLPSVTLHVLPHGCDSTVASDSSQC